jgi:hypothetical protein
MFVFKIQKDMIASFFLIGAVETDDVATGVVVGIQKC